MQVPRAFMYSTRPALHAGNGGPARKVLTGQPAATAACANTPRQVG